MNYEVTRGVKPSGGHFETHAIATMSCNEPFKSSQEITNLSVERVISIVGVVEAWVQGRRWWPDHI